MQGIRFYAERQPWGNGIALHMSKSQGERFDVAQPVVLQKTEPDTITDPFLRIDIRAAQQLMDELWQCGLRPTEGTGSAGSLAATERHLDDMRRLVFKAAHQPRKGGAQ